MEKYTTAATAIADMHERGFTNDFQLIGNDLLWIQGKSFLRPHEFTIVEFHRFWNPSVAGNNLTLFGVIATNCNVRGILFVNEHCDLKEYPFVILKKMHELNQKVLYRINIENESI